MITKRILLTGASGYLGQHLLSFWLRTTTTTTTTSSSSSSTTDPSVQWRNGLVSTISCSNNNNNNEEQQDKIQYEITALYHQRKGFPEAVQEFQSRIVDEINKDDTNNNNNNVQIKVVSMDISNEQECDKFFSSSLSSLSSFDDGNNNNHIKKAKLVVSNYYYDICIHTAAISSPKVCQESPEMARSINIPQAFLRHLHQSSIPIIVLSTDQVYDGTKQTIQQEDGNPNFYNELDDIPTATTPPLNIYGQSKLELEHLVKNLYGGGNNNNDNNDNTQNNNNNDNHDNTHTTATSSSSLLSLSSSSTGKRVAASVIILRASIILGPKAPIDPNHTHDTFLHFVQSRANQETTYFTNEYRTVVSVQHVCRCITYFINQSIYYNHNHNNNDDDDNNNSNDNKSNPRTNICGKVIIYNMGGPIRVNRWEMAKAVFEYLGINDKTLQDKYILSSLQTSVTSPLDISMDSTKLQLATGIVHEPTTLQGIVQATLDE